MIAGQVLIARAYIRELEVGVAGVFCSIGSLATLWTKTPADEPEAEDDVERLAYSSIEYLLRPDTASGGTVCCALRGCR